MNNVKESRFVASLHTHVRSLFDAQIEPEALCARIKELGGKGCAITDHGVVSSIEDYRPAFDNAGLKLIPGCELYVDGGILGREHLIVLAANDNGWKGVGKIVTESNKTLSGDFPVINKESLRKIMAAYKGDIIATSACMQGVVCANFLLNRKVEEEMGKLRAKQIKYVSKDSDDYKSAQNVVNNLNNTLSETIADRDELKSIAEQKFTKRENAIKKAKANGEDVTALQKELEADKKAADEAAKKLNKVKDDIKALKKSISNANGILKDVTESTEKYEQYQSKIEALKKELKSDDELYALALAEARDYSEIFGKDNFFIEIQYHGIEEEQICYPKAVEVAYELGIALVATNDVHMLTNSADDMLRRSILKSLRFGDSFNELQKGEDELYLKDDEELRDALTPLFNKTVIDEAISNISVIFDRCNVAFETGKHYPKFSKDGNANKILEEEIEKGIALRFPNGMDEEHKARLEYEIPIIENMGYADYHLVVKDFLEYGRLLGYVPKNRLNDAPLTIEGLKSFISENGWKNQGFAVGPGRGSAVGSLVCYLLGITSLDPLKYGLLFERFLNPERISMPDIDSDFSNTTRSKVIEYVKNKYGEMAVCGIMTTNSQAPKGAVRIAAKYYGLRNKGEAMTSLGSLLAKDIPSDVGTSFDTIIGKDGKVSENGEGVTLYEYLRKKYSDSADALEIIRWAKVIEGSFTQYGAHAAGIVISDNDDVSEYLPLRMNTTLGMLTTQCDMVQVEDNGLLKFDFLGLKTLDIITETIRMIEENHGVIVNPLNIDLEDDNIYKNILSTGKTNSVFQFESAGMKAMLKRFKPQCFEDLIILVSMFRPGPLQYLDGVIDVKNGKKAMTFLTEQLESILGKTYGAIVYQEQVMEICQKLAGYTLGGADTVRRYMSKKKADKLAHEREKFVEGCGVNGISNEISNELFDQMMDFARYAFNKSHAAVYAFNAYITAWLKYYYPAEFFASSLNWADNDKIAGLMHEAVSFGVKVYAPDVNLSDKDITVNNGEIRFGLSLVAGVKNGADVIINERENGNYTSLKDFMIRVSPDATVIEHLIDAGALDCFGKNRKAMKIMATEVKDIAGDITKKSSFVKSATFVLPYVENKTGEELVNLQKEAGLKAEISEPTTVEKLEKRIENANKTLSEYKKELELIRLRDCTEDKTERMTLEKKYLGIYVTEHPMDFYPSAEELGITNISDMEDNCTALYGVITNLTIKNRKSDGAEMAFFTLEDKSGTIDVCVFTKAFAKNKQMIEENRVVKVFGNLNIEESDDGEQRIVKFFANAVESVTEKAPALMMIVSSYVAFKLDIEDDFIDEYAQKDGRALLLLDKSLNEIRRCTYKVSENVKLLPNVTEVTI